MSQVTGRRRPKLTRTSVYYCEVVFNTHIEGYSEKLRLKEIPIEDPKVVADMKYTLEAFLKKPSHDKLIGRSGSKLSAAEMLQAAKTTSRVDQKKVRRYSSTFVPLTMTYVIAIKLWKTDEDGYTEVDGETIKPWIHVVFQDGSSIDMLLKKKRGRK